jgi:hypothetical protein
MRPAPGRRRLDAFAQVLVSHDQSRPTGIIVASAEQIG